MGFLDLFFKKENNLNESIDYFKKFHPKQSFSDMQSTSGEGIEELQPVSGFGVYGKNEVKSFNVFHNRYIDFQLKNERDKIKEYRNVARMPEVADVIEDVVNESTQSDFDGRKIRLVIRDSELKTNDNITKLLQKEFDVLFNQRLEFNKIIEDIVMTYYVDGRVYWENVIDVNKPKRGLLKIKRLPTETMDFVYNVMTGKVEFFIQYLKESKLLPSSIEDAKKATDLIAFWPEQIGYLDYGQYGANKKDVMGYLEKVKAPYNQVKLLETAVVIYRLVRAPERLVFTIDVGNMPRNKAMKFVEQIKLSMQRKEVYDPSSGKMSNQPDVMCIRKDTEIPLLDGRMLPLTEVIREFKEGKENYVYSINRETLIVEPGKIINGAITRKNEKLIRIHLDNDAYVDSTYDHKFIKRDNTDCRADELKVGDALMPFNREFEKITKTKKIVYEQVYNPATEKMEFTHVLSSKWKNGKRKVGCAIHHIDYNRYNNNPTNLKLMGFDEHLKHHSDLIKKQWDENYTEMCQKVGDGIRSWNAIPENAKRKSEWTAETNKSQNKAEKMRKVLNTPEIREKQKEAARKSRLEYFSDENVRKALSDKKSMLIDAYAKQRIFDCFIKFGKPSRNNFLELIKETDILPYLEKLNENQQINNKQFNHMNKQTLLNLIKELGYEDYVDFRKNYNGHKVEGYENHKIIKIEYLEETDDCGCITVEGNHNFAVSQYGKSLIYMNNSILENYFLPSSSEGRGSSINTIGGNPSGFTELDDLYFFHRKMYRALKYPMSRIDSTQEKQSRDNMYQATSSGEITRDEVKWGTFLKNHQDKFSELFLDLFMLHLALRGVAKEFGIKRHMLYCEMTIPNNYISQMHQLEQSTRWDNYSASNSDEFSIYWRMKKFLKLTDEEILANSSGFKRDKELGFAPADEQY